MRRGATPRPIEVWLLNLPEYSGVDGIGVYHGLVGNVYNPVFIIENGELHALYEDSANNQLWRVSTISGVVKGSTSMSSTAVAQGIITASGMSSLTAGAGSRKTTLELDDILFKLIRAV